MSLTFLVYFYQSIDIQNAKRYLQYIRAAPINWLFKSFSWYGCQYMEMDIGGSDKNNQL